MDLMMVASQSQEAARQVGFAAGMVCGGIMMIGAPILFIVSLIFAVNRKSTPWIVVAVISGLISMVLVGIFVFGFITGIANASKRASGLSSGGTTAHADRIVSNDGMCSLDFPAHWIEMPDLHEDATIQVGNGRQEEYLVVLTDLKEDFAGSLGDHVEITSGGMLEVLENPWSSEPEWIVVNGFPAVRLQIRGTTESVNIAYTQTTIEGYHAYYQILAWTLSSSADSKAAIFDEVASSFREEAGPR